MNQRARLRDELPVELVDADELRSASIRRRRAEAAAVRRRRLLLVDVGCGLAVALVLLLLAPGLAIVGLVLILAMAGLLGWTIFRLLRRRRARTRRPSTVRHDTAGGGVRSGHG